MFKRIVDLEPGDLFIMSYLSDLKMGKVLYNTGESIKVEITRFPNTDFPNTDLSKEKNSEIRYIYYYRYVFKIS